MGHGHKCRPNVDPAETKGRDWCKYALEAVAHVYGSTGERAPFAHRTAISAAETRESFQIMA